MPVSNTTYLIHLVSGDLSREEEKYIESLDRILTLLLSLNRPDKEEIPEFESATDGREFSVAYTGFDDRENNEGRLNSALEFMAAKVEENIVQATALMVLNPDLAKLLSNQQRIRNIFNLCFESEKTMHRTVSSGQFSMRRRLISYSRGLERVRKVQEVMSRVKVFLASTEAIQKSSDPRRLSINRLITFIREASTRRLQENQEIFSIMKEAFRTTLIALEGRRVPHKEYDQNVIRQIRELVTTEETFNRNMKQFAEDGSVFQIVRDLQNEGIITETEAALLMQDRVELKKKSSFFLNMIRGEIPFDFEIVDAFLNLMGEMALKNDRLSEVVQKIQCDPDAVEVIRDYGLNPQSFETRFNEPFQRMIRLKMLLEEVERRHEGNSPISPLADFLRAKLELVDAMNQQPLDLENILQRVKLLKLS